MRFPAFIRFIRNFLDWSELLDGLLIRSGLVGADSLRLEELASFVMRQPTSCSSWSARSEAELSYRTDPAGNIAYILFSAF